MTQPIQRRPVPVLALILILSVNGNLRAEETNAELAVSISPSQLITRMFNVRTGMTYKATISTLGLDDVKKGGARPTHSGVTVLYMAQPGDIEVGLTFSKIEGVQFTDWPLEGVDLHIEHQVSENKWIMNLRRLVLILPTDSEP